MQSLYRFYPPPCIGYHRRSVRTVLHVGQGVSNRAHTPGQVREGGSNANMRQNKAPRQADAIRSLLEKARKENRVNQSEINALFSDSSSKQAQDFYAELETIGAEIFSDTGEIEDDEDVDLDL